MNQPLSKVEADLLMSLAESEFGTWIAFVFWGAAQNKSLCAASRHR